MTSSQFDLFTGKTHYQNIMDRLTEKINNEVTNPIESISIKQFYTENNIIYR
jgi:hypothetical protein